MPNSVKQCQAVPNSVKQCQAHLHHHFKTTFTPFYEFSAVLTTFTPFYGTSAVVTTFTLRVASTLFYGGFVLLLRNSSADKAKLHHEPENVVSNGGVLWGTHTPLLPLLPGTHTGVDVPDGAFLG